MKDSDRLDIRAAADKAAVCAQSVGREANREYHGASGEELNKRYGHAADCMSEAPANLTTRESEVMTLRAGGLRAKEIAVRLNISYRTVETHIRHATLKTRRL